MRILFSIPARPLISLLALTLFCGTARTLRAQPGPEFRVNTYTTGAQRSPAIDKQGDNFVVAWESDGQDGDLSGIFARSLLPTGVPLGPEFQVNTYTTAAQHVASVGGTNGFSVVAWQSEGQDGDQGGIYARRFDAGGPVGGEFRVNTFVEFDQVTPAVDAEKAGNFVVVWASLGQDGSDSGIFAQRYSSAGSPMGGEFRVNTWTTGFQGHPAVAMEPDDGAYVVLWDGEGPGDSAGVFGQRFLTSGPPLGPQFLVNTFPAGNQSYPAVASDITRFCVAWQSDGEDGSGYGVYRRPYNLWSGQPEGAAGRVNAFTAGSQAHPTVAMVGIGSAVIAWDDDTQDPQGGVYGRLHGMGPPTGCFDQSGIEFRLNTTTAGSQSDPAMAYGGFLGGGFALMVGWTSDQDPDGSPGIYAEISEENWLPVELQDFTVD
jgi:hypothetical protein